MIGRHPSATRTDPLFPATTLFRAPAVEARDAARGDIVEDQRVGARPAGDPRRPAEVRIGQIGQPRAVVVAAHVDHAMHDTAAVPRSEEHTSELQSLMRISYAVFCLTKKTTTKKKQKHNDKTT